MAAYTNNDKSLIYNLLSTYENSTIVPISGSLIGGIVINENTIDINRSFSINFENYDYSLHHRLSKPLNFGIINGSFSISGNLYDNLSWLPDKTDKLTLGSTDINQLDTSPIVDCKSLSITTTQNYVGNNGDVVPTLLKKFPNISCLEFNTEYKSTFTFVYDKLYTISLCKFNKLTQVNQRSSIKSRKQVNDYLKDDMKPLHMRTVSERKLFSEFVILSHIGHGRRGALACQTELIELGLEEYIT